ncbi:MAG: hypothetical protein QOH57_3194 [Mycobacterium sp.]|jgi:hypothetical protein|nr:hypothetical protein [Mycobacterium sp.]
MIRTIVRCAEHRQRPIAEELVHPVSHHLPEKTLIGVTRLACAVSVTPAPGV